MLFSCDEIGYDLHAICNCCDSDYDEIWDLIFLEEGVIPEDELYTYDDLLEEMEEERF